MARSFHQNFAHVIFSTKGRAPMITGDIEPKLHAYLGGTVRDLGGQPIRINGMEDHVHLIVQTPKQMTDSDFMRELKANSSKWMKSQSPAFRQFSWQLGYGWFSVSKSTVDEVVAYIGRQKEHHRKMTFKEEFRSLLERSGVEFDERYLWE